MRTFIPTLRSYIAIALQHEGLKRYSRNTGWILLARVISFAVSFLTVAIVARYLGPENYGKLSYAQSFVAICSVFASLGIDQILFRDLVAHPERERELLGTAVFSKAVFGVLALLGTVAAAYYLDSDPLLTGLIFILSLTFITQPFGILANFFGAKVASKYASYSTIFIAFLIPVLKLAIVYFDQGILYFAGLLLLESALYSVFYIYIYITRFHGSPFQWRVTGSTFTQLFHDSWPLLLASLSGYIYGRIDQVMIQHAINSTSVGLYDAAVRITELWVLVPGIIIASVFPAIVNARTQPGPSYRRRLRALSLGTIGMGVFASGAIFALAPFIITTVFGKAFIGSIIVLRIYVWTGIGTVAIALIQNYLIAENNGKIFFVLSLTGAVSNIILNVFLIPRYGMIGAAFATVFSYLFMVALFFLFTTISRSKNTRAQLLSGVSTA